MVIKKRQIVTATLVLALGSAVFINWYYTRPESELANAGTSIEAVEESAGNLGDAQYVNATTTAQSTATSSSKNEYFAAAKLRRTSAHDEAAEVLNDIIKDESADASAVKEATAALTALSKAIKLEGDMEALIKAKIGSECVVLINNEKVEIIVGKDVLDDGKILQIKEIALNQTEIPVENITIVELSS
ncbi:MAG: SpoIIIAH-like family protein [Oscillospiraceae bacterium]|nr:SpoIIIAH-like family protein [Oscillospiraceae bacterium]